MSSNSAVMNSNSAVMNFNNDTEYETENETENDKKNYIYLKIKCENNTDIEFSSISKVNYDIDISGHDINTLNIKYRKCDSTSCKNNTYNIDNLKEFLKNFTKVGEIDGYSEINLTDILIYTKKDIINNVDTYDFIVLNRLRKCIKILRKERKWDDFLKNIVKIGMEVKPKIIHGKHGRHRRHGKHGKHI